MTGSMKWVSSLHLQVGVQHSAVEWSRATVAVSNNADQARTSKLPQECGKIKAPILTTLPTIHNIGNGFEISVGM